MALIFNSIALDLTAVLITLLGGIITYFKWSYTYWKNQKVPYLEPSFPFGTLGNLITEPKSTTERCKMRYFDAKSKGYKHVGLYAFANPIYMPIHPAHIKSIVSTDFQYFVNRGLYYNEKDDPISAHLFNIEGAKWRHLRIKFTPTFTSGKMKMMFETLVESSRQMKVAMDDVCDKTEPVDIKDVVARFTIDIIGSCAFGLNCNSFKDPNSNFRKYGKRIFNSTPLETLKIFLSFASPSLARSLRIRAVPKEVSDFFMNVIRGSVDYRRNNKVTRRDFLQLLLELKNNNDNGRIIKGLSVEELAGQSFVFFIAGYETSSTTMTFCLFELSVNPEIQERVRQEINSVLDEYDGEITYDALTEMKYLDQVIDETLRKYPPLPYLNRKCTKDYRIPGTDSIIKKGVAVLIPVAAIQNDPEYFPEPDKFDPERFNAENTPKIKPYTYMPFGEGPRVCIGLRFGLMETKVGLAVLLKNYRFSLNERTQTPLQMDPHNFVTSTLGDIWLNVERL